MKVVGWWVGWLVVESSGEKVACSLGLRWNDETRRVECTSPEEVETESVVREAVELGVRVEECGLGDAACIREVAERAIRPARWPSCSDRILEGAKEKAVGSSVLIVTPSDRRELYEKTRPSWERYAARWGYGYVEVDAVELPGRSAHWVKIWLLKELGRLASIVAIVDDDVVVTNASIRLDLVMDDVQDDAIAVGDDPLLTGFMHPVTLKFNTGVLASKNFGRRVEKLLLDAWLAPFSKSNNECWLGTCPFWDQSALVHAASADTVAVLPYRSLQSFWNGPVCAVDWIDPDCDVRNRQLAWRPGDFSAHVSGQGLHHRLSRLDRLREALDAAPYGPVDLAAVRTVLLDVILANCDSVNNNAVLQPLCSPDTDTLPTVALPISTPHLIQAATLLSSDALDRAYADVLRRYVAADTSRPRRRQLLQSMRTATSFTTIRSWWTPVGSCVPSSSLLLAGLRRVLLLLRRSIRPAAASSCRRFYSSNC